MRAFLYQTARNLVVDYFRSKRSISLDTLLEKGFEPSGNAGRDPEKQLESREVQFLLLKLRAADREVIVMRYIDGLKPREIASITIDLPAPVSPERIFNPSLKVISAESMIAIFLMFSV